LVYSMTERPNFWFQVDPGSAETVAMGGGITNHHLIANSLRNISAKNYQNRLMCVEVIVCYISVVFLRHGVVTHYQESKFFWFLLKFIYIQRKK